MPKRHIGASHRGARRRRGQQGQKKQYEVEDGNLLALANQLSGRRGGGVARNIGQDGGPGLACGGFVHIESARACAQRYGCARSRGETGGGITVADRNLEQTEAAECRERRTFERKPVS